MTEENADPKPQTFLPSEEFSQNLPIPPELFEQRGRTFSIINQKGGCGKTTTAINLSAALAGEGFRVLLIDLDAQANATLGLGLQLAPEDKTIAHIFQETPIDPSEILHTTSFENLFLLPASRTLASLAVEVLKAPNWEYLLRSFLRSLKHHYHFILNDCPPALNALTINALTASEDILIPLQTHYFALEGMKELFLTVQLVRERLNPLLRKGWILPTLYDQRTRMHREILRSLREYFQGQVLETVIHTNIRLSESTMHGQPVLSYDPTSAGARDYRALAQEILRREASLLSAGIGSP